MSRTCPSCGKTYDDGVFFCGEDGQIVVQDQSPEDFDSRLGKTLGGYVVAARVADGAMGRVFEGRHPDTKDRVAIKVLHDDVVRDKTAVERFKREYETAQEMDHPGVVKVLEFGETGDGSFFMTMEFLEGQELSKITGQPQPAARILRVVCQAAVALDYAHSFGFVHRDLKPDNIFLCREEGGEDSVRLLDFGSVKLQMEMGAKLTAIGTTLGSPYYMSPEQATGAADLDQRTDVFALGAILYEMLTGKVAFEAPNVALILMKIMNESPPPASTIADWPASLDDVVDKALRKDKTTRYAAATDLANGMLKAFGLEGDAESWSHRSEGEIEEALSAATPAKAKAYGTSLPAPGAQPATAAQGGPQPEPASQPMTAPNLRPSDVGSWSRDTAPTVSRGRGAMLGLAAAGLLLVGLIAYFMR